MREKRKEWARNGGREKNMSIEIILEIHHF